MLEIPESHVTVENDDNLVWDARGSRDPSSQDSFCNDPSFDRETWDIDEADKWF